LSKIINLIKDTISPKICYSCKKEWHFLCQQCQKTIWEHFPYCYICKSKSQKYMLHWQCQTNVNFDKIIVKYHYKNNTIKRLIKDSKYYNRHEILYEFWQSLSNLLLENEHFENEKDYIIIASPMYLFRKLIRGYNHSEILAKIISKETQILYNFDIIKKVRHTKQQSKLNKKERENNLKWAFSINKKFLNQIIWKNIIVVDDVISTWTTINEIAKILKTNKAKKVIWLVIASD